MSKIGDLRAGLKTNLDVIPGFNVSRYALSQPKGSVPVIHLWPTSVRYHGAMQQGLDTVIFRVEAVVPSSAVEQGPQFLLDKLLGTDDAESVVLAIEADPTLGGECDDLIVDSMDQYEYVVDQTNATWMMAAWSVRVFVG